MTLLDLLGPSIGIYGSRYPTLTRNVSPVFTGTYWGVRFWNVNRMLNSMESIYE